MKHRFKPGAKVYIRPDYKSIGYIISFNKTIGIKKLAMYKVKVYLPKFSSYKEYDFFGIDMVLKNET